MASETKLDRINGPMRKKWGLLKPNILRNSKKVLKIELSLK
jgi:hypothetical protein